MSYQGYILYTEDKGIFIGSFLGLGFWSKLDPVNQTHAIVFESKEIAEQLISEWLTHPGNFKLIPIQTQELGYASLEEISAIGLPIWSSDSPAVADGLACEPLYDFGLIDFDLLTN